jgi:hypothetical protein
VHQKEVLGDPGGCPAPLGLLRARSGRSPFRPFGGMGLWVRRASPGGGLRRACRGGRGDACRSGCASVRSGSLSLGAYEGGRRWALFRDRAPGWIGHEEAEGRFLAELHGDDLVPRPEANEGANCEANRNTQLTLLVESGSSAFPVPVGHAVAQVGKEALSNQVWAPVANDAALDQRGRGRSSFDVVQERVGANP